jgi:hypothetical protein
MMKALAGWLCDPCVHLLVIGVLLVHLAMSASADGDSTGRDDSDKNCQACRGYHEPYLSCPLLSANGVTRLTKK